ncbi:MAG: ribbon-helix-helix protein, CopG family [Nitrospinae bacterium]|nr:ribbon-helix-helix protein, CopG family [Nitrospinota bacterium]
MVRINTILPEDTIEKLDIIAKDEHKSRSMLLREAAEKIIEDYQRRAEEKIKREQIKNAIDIQDRLRKKSGKWNAVSELRKWREMVK